MHLIRYITYIGGQMYICYVWMICMYCILCQYIYQHSVCMYVYICICIWYYIFYIFSLTQFAPCENGHLSQSAPREVSVSFQSKIKTPSIIRCTTSLCGRGRLYTDVYYSNSTTPVSLSLLSASDKIMIIYYNIEKL